MSKRMTMAIALLPTSRYHTPATLMVMADTARDKLLDGATVVVFPYPVCLLQPSNKLKRAVNIHAENTCLYGVFLSTDLQLYVPSNLFITIVSL